MRLSDQQIRCLLIAGANMWLRERAWLLDALTVSSTYTNEIEVTGKQIQPGKILDLEAMKYESLKTPGAVVRINQKHVGIITKIENDLITVEVLTDGSSPCFNLMDVMDVASGTVQQIFGSHPFTTTKWGDTTVGRYLCNVIVLQYPFNFQVFTYQNYRWNPDDIVKLVTAEILGKRITTQEYEKFWDHIYFIGHMSELNTPSMTEKSLQTNPKVPEIKKKFLESHKGQMHDPLVIQQLESELIKADKEYLGDDPSVRFFNGLGKSTFDVKRKKLFLTVGGIAAFGTDSNEMDFVPNSLIEGWTKETLPSIANEIRKGSYERGVETAKGGAETKLVMRVFQDAVIAEDDCGTSRTIKIDCSQFDGKQFIGRVIRVGNTDVIVTPENLDKYVTNKVIHLYSPLTCETKFNFCRKCCGARSKDLGVRQIGFQTIKITNKFMQNAMKNMHGTALEVRDNKLEDILL